MSIINSENPVALRVNELEHPSFSQDALPKGTSWWLMWKENLTEGKSSKSLSIVDRPFKRTAVTQELQDSYHQNCQHLSSSQYFCHPSYNPFGFKPPRYKTCLVLS